MNETQENKQITEPGKEEFEKTDIFGVGAPNNGFAQYFTGNSFLKPLTEPEKCPVFLANVTFEPGCRNNWHIHHAKEGGGQILICTAGKMAGTGMGQRGKRANRET